MRTKNGSFWAGDVLWCPGHSFILQAGRFLEVLRRTGDRVFLLKCSMHEQLEGNVFLAAGKECLYEVCDETASWRLMYIWALCEILGSYITIW